MFKRLFILFFLSVCSLSAAAQTNHSTSDAKEITEWKLPHIYFGDHSDSLIESENLVTLSKVRSILESRHDVMVVVIGHVDASEGSNVEQATLATQRSMAVRQWITQKNEAFASQIHMVGYTSAWRAKEQASPAENRYVEFRFIPLNISSEERDRIVSELE